MGRAAWAMALYGPEMAREVVTGYCWPQSAQAREPVGLHMSSSGGRPVRVEVARVSGQL